MGSFRRRKIQTTGLKNSFRIIFSTENRSILRDFSNVGVVKKIWPLDGFEAITLLTYNCSATDICIIQATNANEDSLRVIGSFRKREKFKLLD